MIPPDLKKEYNHLNRALDPALISQGYLCHKIGFEQAVTLMTTITGKRVDELHSVIESTKPVIQNYANEIIRLEDLLCECLSYKERLPIELQKKIEETLKINSPK